MISKEDIQSLLLDLENDRVERTISTTNTDKFGEAICAFANDLPNHQQPGYLIIGADDKTGRVVPIQITDALLRNIGAIRVEGNIQPQPSMTVERVALDDGEVIVVEVDPAHFPPVKYKGKTCVRIGPRKGYANENDEKKLLEKRASHVLTFDALPCLGTTLADVDSSLFKLSYLSKAYPQDVYESDKRDVRLQMQSLGFYDMKFDCPTNAGVLMFGYEVERFFPGAYVQYVRFGGKNRAAEIFNEYKFSGNLMNILYQLDSFVKTTVARKRPVPVSALREETVYDYPLWAIRELMMNACCHRDYEGNGPIQFYQYDDRVEILNPGGLYGKATPQNFPWVNDYRNAVVAEAMKVLGFVNRFSRGVQRVQDELKANGNGEAKFRLDLETAFLATVPLSERVMEMMNEDVKFTDNRRENSSSDFDGTVNGTVNGRQMLDPMHIAIFQAVVMNQNLTYRDLSKALNIQRTTLYRKIKDLKDWKYIIRDGSDKSGRWIILNQLPS